MAYGIPDNIIEIWRKQHDWPAGQEIPQNIVYLWARENGWPIPEGKVSDLPIHGAPYGPRDPEAWVRTPTPGGIVVTPREKEPWRDQRDVAVQTDLIKLRQEWEDYVRDISAGKTPRPVPGQPGILQMAYGTPLSFEAWLARRKGTVTPDEPTSDVITPRDEETTDVIAPRQPTGPVLPSPANWKGSVVDYARAVRDWVKTMRRTGSDIDYSVMLTGPLNWLEKQGSEGKVWADWLRSSILPTSPWSEWHKPTPTPKVPPKEEGREPVWPTPPYVPPERTPRIDQPTPLSRITPDERTEETVFPGLDRYPRAPQPNIPTPKPEFPTPGRPPKIRTAFENIWAWRKKRPLWW